MAYRVCPLVLSLLTVVFIPFVLVGLTLGTPNAALFAASDQPTAPRQAGHSVLNGATTTRTTAAPEGPTETPTATATGCPGGPFDILLVYTDDGPTLLLRGELLAQPTVASVTLFNAYVDTPTLAELQPYDLVIAMGNLDYENPVTLGDNLADYHDGGGLVVPVFGSFFDIENYALRGRWDTGGYSPYTYGSSVIATTVTLGSYDPMHPLMKGVTTLNAIARVDLTPAPAATEVAVYSDGSSAVVYKTTGVQTSVGLSAYLGDSFNRGTGDYATVIVNTAEWLLAGECPTATPTATEFPTSLRIATLESGNGTIIATPLLVVGLLGMLAGLSILRYRRRSE